jgi:hypothetical protein
MTGDCSSTLLANRPALFVWNVAHVPSKRSSLASAGGAATWLHNLPPLTKRCDAAPDDEIVDNLDVDESHRPDDLPRIGHIAPRRFGVSGRVAADTEHRFGITGERGPHDFARVDLHPVDRSTKQLGEIDQAMIPIQEESAERRTAVAPSRIRRKISSKLG